ncbi:hypothetical protein BOX15_Mlig012923g2 [Macrostomum lignano]|uniref:NTF2-related export protein n=1 Tax=Macrostomum lignano TaxID=282301 RepID=A0A267H227_9PLAT|nr:hypothetical protein BOX15_Mlig012923g3 [Macrostomum lignano]PAA92351.1 hypothetical protein BOX15_Mlig012923g2 [Macrostomum lignano]
MSSDNNKPLDQARCDAAAVRFCTMYYKRMSDTRQNLTPLYADQAVLAWNGHRHSGKQEIGQFYAQLPNCIAQPYSVSAQLLDGDIFPPNSLLATCHGQVKFLRCEDRRHKLFSQAFVLSRQSDGTFVILSDTFRTSEP